VLTPHEMQQIYQLYNGPIFYITVSLIVSSLFIKDRILKLLSVLTGVIALLLIIFNVSKFFVQQY
jgi:hypothetical protein